MKTRILLLLAVAVALAAILALPALAAKPDCSVDPTHPSCRDGVPEEVVWTCAARVDNGASGWVIGEWIGLTGLPIEIDPAGDAPVYYRTDNASGAIPACIDIHPDHVSETRWSVAWNADEDSVISQKRNGGLMMLFEREIHSDPYAEHIAKTPVGSWDATFDLSPYDPGYTVDNLVFAAMPAHRDTWLFADGYLTITPHG